MAKGQIKGKVREGCIAVVRNENPHRFASRTYLMAWVEDEADGREKPLLFTEGEAAIAAARGVRKSSMAPSGSRVRFFSRSRLGHMSVVENLNKAHRFEADYYYFVKLESPEGRRTWYAFTERQMKSIRHRTESNPEDVVRKSFLTDLTD